jgi:hypothetical protein
MKDLEPYVCLWDHCTDHETNFREQNVWMNHMRSHALRWTCRLPGHPRGQGNIIFTSETEFETHLNRVHPTTKTLNLAQVNILKRQCSSADPNPFKICPLCQISIDNISGQRPGSELVSASSQSLKMQKHIASHLQMIASYSLPWLDGAYSDISSDKALSSCTESTLSSADENQVALLEASLANANALDEMEDLMLCDPDVAAEEQQQSEEWNFMPEPSYEGQEFDPVLESFVRKYHVDMAFTESTAKVISLPCVYMPMSKNTDFFGREDTVKALEGALCLNMQSSLSGIKSYSVHGPAGIGKTQVAIEFVHRFMHQFDAVFWIHADEISKILEDINRITNQLGLVDEKSADSEDQALTVELFKAWLKTPLRSLKEPSAGLASWLLVLDHVIEPAITHEFWPAGCQSGSILITSRRTLPWDSVLHKSTSLERLTPEQGAEFMCRLVRREISPEERSCASLISINVYGVPYALKHLAKWIVEADLTFAEFLAQHSNSEKIKSQTDLKGVSRLFSISEEHSFLKSTFNSIRHCGPLLDVLSMLDPDHIPERILRTTSKSPGVGKYPTTEVTYQNSIQELLRFGLVTRSNWPDAIFMHRIVQDAARKRMKPLYYREVFNTCVELISLRWYAFHFLIN